MAIDDNHVDNSAERETSSDPASELIASLVDDVASSPDAAQLFSIDAEPVAEGSCATIHLGRDQQSKNCSEDVSGLGIDGYVFKIFIPNAYKSAGDELTALHTELTAFMAIPPHPNILRYFNTFWLHNGINEERALHSRWALQFEYCSGGDIYTVATKHPFQEARARSVMHDLLKALAHMNSNELVHRDVKPENILMQGSGNCKLADFGLCASMGDEKEMKKRCGTPGYVAPEVWLGNRYGAQVDTFSAGAVLYFMLTGKMLFYGSGLPSIMRKTVHNEVDFSRSKRFENCTQACKDFLITILMKKPDLRPSPNFCLRSPWIVNVDIEPVFNPKDSPRRVCTWSSGISVNGESSSCFSTDYGTMTISSTQSSVDYIARIDSDGWPRVDSQSETPNIQSPSSFASAKSTPTYQSPRLPISSCKSMGTTPDSSPSRARPRMSLWSASSASAEASNSSQLSSVFQHPLSTSTAWQTPDNSPIIRQMQTPLLPESACHGVLSPVEPGTPRHSTPGQSPSRRIRDLPSISEPSSSSQLAKLCEVVSKDVTLDPDEDDKSLYDNVHVHPPREGSSPSRKSAFFKFRNFVRLGSKRASAP